MAVEDLISPDKLAAAQLYFLSNPNHSYILLKLLNNQVKPSETRAIDSLDVKAQALAGLVVIGIVPDLASRCTKHREAAFSAVLTYLFPGAQKEKNSQVETRIFDLHFPL